MKAVMNLLKDNGLGENADFYTLDVLGDNFELYEMAYQDMIENGIYVVSDRGNKQLAPSYSLYNRCGSTIIRMLSDYGISTRSRKQIMRIDSESNSGESPLMKFFSEEDDEQQGTGNQIL